MKNEKLTQKAKVVKAYEKFCPQKLVGYVTQVVGYKTCEDWNYNDLADEFGFGYMMYWDEKLQKLRNSN
jgi:hypothetical protein